MPSDSEKDSSNKPEYRHVKYGFCTIHGMGICPVDCPAPVVNELICYSDKTFIDRLRGN